MWFRLGSELLPLFLSDGVLTLNRSCKVPEYTAALEVLGCASSRSIAGEKLARKHTLPRAAAKRVSRVFHSQQTRLLGCAKGSPTSARYSSQRTNICLGPFVTHARVCPFRVVRQECTHRRTVASARTRFSFPRDTSGTHVRQFHASLQ